MTLTITPSEVQEDDVIVAVDGYEVTPRTVTAVFPAGHVHVEQPFDAVYSADRYLDKFATITVKRGDEPEAPKPKRQVTRTIDGIKWIAQGEQHWVTEDGRFEINYEDDFITECDEPHPVRFSRELRYAMAAGTVDLRHFPSEARIALSQGRKGYYCYGGEEHTYGLWVSGAVEGEPQVISRDHSFAAACSQVATHIATGKIWA